MVGNDLRFALRQLYKRPAFALAVVLTLALGIGVNTAVFSLVNGFMLKPLPYPEPSRLAALVLHKEGVSARSGQAFAEEDNSFALEDWDPVLAGVPGAQFAAYSSVSGVNLKAGAEAGAAVRYVHDMRVSADYFNVLGIAPKYGRSFTADEDRAGGPKAVILSYAVWQQAFRSDVGVLGRAITLKGEPYSVVGVLPPNAKATMKADIWTPLAISNPRGECGGNATNCGILMRLRPGATWQQVATQLSTVHLVRAQDVEQQAKNGRAWLYAEPLARSLGDDQRTPLLMLMAAVSFVLLIACANLAGLTLVSIARRTQEVATRLALGATRWAVLRQLWIESLVLALLGAGSGLLLAVGILKAAASFLPEAMIPLGGLSLDARVLAFTFVASLITSLLFGALPALHTRRVDLRSSIVGGSHAVAGGSSRPRQFLIAAEVALTVVLLAGAGLLIRTLVYLETIPPGFNAHGVMTAKLSLDDVRYHNVAAFQGLLRNSLAAMRQIPGVEDAAVGLSVPYERGLNDYMQVADGKLAGQGNSSSTAYITPDYFRVLRMRLLAGREFTDSDSADSEPVVIVNQAFARKYFQEPAPLGRHLKLGNKMATVVGVVTNVAKRSGVYEEAPLSTEPVYYFPATQADEKGLAMAHIWFQPSWIVRTAGPVQGLTQAMQRALSEADPGLPFSGFYSMNDILAENLQFQRMEVLLLGVLAALALLLSAVGIYGLVSNLVVQRTREIGIRIALGSSMRDAMVHIGSSGLVATGVGLVCGLGLSFFVLRLLKSEIYGISSYDPLTLVAVPAVLACIAAVASFLPTLRITRIDPAQTLRTE